MREDFLHYIWRFKKFDFLHAATEGGDSIQLLNSGRYNEEYSGPDFFNARLRIGDQLWAGNVEIHIHSSDWYAHQHQKDVAYDNVILHVVWEHDVEVFRQSNTKIPTLALKKWVAPETLSNYKKLLEYDGVRWINCAPDFHSFSDFDVKNSLERLYIERLEQKSTLIFELLAENKRDWEATLFVLLAKNFGLNRNGEAFLEMAQSVPFAAVRKIYEHWRLEALFLGQAGLLEKESVEVAYFSKLKSEYLYLRRKFELSVPIAVKVHFFRLRPPNFPTIRLSQLAGLYTRHKNLFQKVIKEQELRVIREIFSVTTSEFWKTHYTFQKESTSVKKLLTRNFIDLIIINTLVPLKFCYQKARGKQDFEALMALMSQLPPEKNNVVAGFNKLRKGTANNALEAQALLQLKKNYCDRNRCLQCALGIKLLGKP